MLKKTIITVYILVLLALGSATIVEKFHGSVYATENFYTSWWITTLWILLSLCGSLYILRRKVRRLSVLSLHLSFLLILLGAFLTHLTSSTGMLHLRKGIFSDTYIANSKEPDERRLPFSLRLDSFEISKHAGTEAVSDYISHLTVSSGTDSASCIVSMNNILKRSGVRIYQSSYDPDGEGTILSVNSDPYGIPLTYSGYALLFISLVWVLIDPRGNYRQILRHPLLRKSILGLLFLLCFSTAHSSPRSLSQKDASRMCSLCVLYNDRICPLETYALDFTKKLYGSRSYKGYSAEQVFTGFLFWRDEWMQEPILKVKDTEVRNKLGFSKYIRPSELFKSGEGYILGPYLNEYYRGASDKFHEGINRLDEKMGLLMKLHNHEPLKLFPFTHDGATTWYCPNESYPDYIVADQQTYMRTIIKYLYDSAQKGDYKTFDETISKLIKYQHTFGGASLPSPTRLRAEHIYNKIPFATILFMVNLTLGILSFIFTIYRLTHTKLSPLTDMIVKSTEVGIMTLSFLSITLCLSLRWLIRGTIPMSNGYETMLLMSWIIMLASLALFRKFRIILSFGFLLSGFFLLVSHISQMDPQITHLMPVLSSPLLTIHVSIIMMAYALLSLTFICGLTALLLRLFRGKDAECLGSQIESLQLLSQLLLYPSIAAMGMGIFIGAIWANISWGTYWSWDPKETWALITFMVYAAAVHTSSLPIFRRPLAYHWFITLSFLTILMTYFGVNYFLGGMHSYA